MPLNNCKFVKFEEKVKVKSTLEQTMKAKRGCFFTIGAHGPAA